MKVNYFVARGLDELNRGIKIRNLSKNQIVNIETDSKRTTTTAYESYDPQKQYCCWFVESEKEGS